MNFAVLSAPTRPGWFCSLLAGALLALTQIASAVTLAPQEQQILNYMQGSGQNRPFLQVDPILTQVARHKAADMAARHYYSHVTPEGVGPNYLVRQAGYKLPDSWSQDPQANYVESVDAGYPDAQSTWDTWMGSPDHKEHLLATNSFYADQTSIGIGFAADPNSDWQYYWVVITAPPQAIATLTINTPAPSAQVTVPQVTYTGVTGGTLPTARVAWRLENAAGVTDYQNATGIGVWSAQVTLAPGPNVVRFCSFDATGKPLTQAVRATYYILPADLTVNIAGSGTVTAGFAGTSTRYAGFASTIAATPAAGMLFNGWTGSVTSASSVLKFTMQPGFQLTANFVPNPFPAVKGGYYGLLSDNSSGRIGVMVTPLGSFSLAVYFEGRGYTMRGQFNPNGDATVMVPRAGLTPLQLSLHLDLNGGGVSGTVTDGTSTASISSARLYDSTVSGAYAKAGHYTVALPPDPSSTDTTLPQGVGIAGLSISATGTAVLVGALPDGQTFLFSSRMNADNTMSIWSQLGSNASTIKGSLVMTPSDVSDLQGTLHWVRAAKPSAAVHPAALDTTLPLIGSLYVAPKPGSTVVNVPSSLDNTQLTLSQGDLTVPVNQPATLSTANQVVLSQPVLQGLNAAINPAIGYYHGTFIHPVSHALSVFRGVIFQKQNSGYGYFVGPAASGYSSLEPAQ